MKPSAVSCRMQNGRWELICRATFSRWRELATPNSTSMPTSRSRQSGHRDKWNCSRSEAAVLFRPVRMAVGVAAAWWMFFSALTGVTERLCCGDRNGIVLLAEFGNPAECRQIAKAHYLIDQPKPESVKRRQHVLALL